MGGAVRTPWYWVEGPGAPHANEPLCKDTVRGKHHPLSKYSLGWGLFQGLPSWEHIAGLSQTWRCPSDLARA